MDQIDSVLAAWTAVTLLASVYSKNAVRWYHQPAVAWGGLTLLAHVVFG